LEDFCPIPKLQAHPQTFGQAIGNRLSIDKRFPIYNNFVTPTFHPYIIVSKAILSGITKKLLILLKNQ
jgi:hypothetical protein